MPDTPPPVLSPTEARVLAVLIEKQSTVPDIYPLTLNALVAGCNQKTSREPVMQLGDVEVQEALDGLRRRTLVIESSGGRAMRYAHNARRVLGVPTESVALLAVLMLRGPQTAAELRANAERLQRFSDASALEGFLDELAQWPTGPMVRRLPRQPGAREQRWQHLLCGTPLDEVLSPECPSPLAHTRGAHLRDTDSDSDTDLQRIALLEARIGQLEATVAKLCDALGLESADADTP